MSQSYGPNIPKHTIGPALPPHMLKSTSSDEDNSDTNPIPPIEHHEIKDIKLVVPETSKISNQHLDENYGPALPPHLQKVPLKKPKDDSESDEDYGPLPAGISSKSLAQQALEERALQLKLDSLQSSQEDKSDVREQWMLELPEVGGAHLGLGARQFRKNARPDFSDRSSWTDTPEKTEKKKLGTQDVVVDIKKEAELREIAKRNKEKDKLIDEYNKKKKRDKSLVDLHQEKLKKTKLENQETSTGRRPFNRDTDLKINQFDDAQKKSIMKKAMHLDDRFSRGQSKYL